MYFVLPIWAGQFEDVFGFSSAQIGWLLSADMGANTLAVLSVWFWVQKVNLRIAVAIAATVFAVANLACLRVDSFTTLLVLRWVVGLGMGVLAGVAIAGIGLTRKPDRNFAFALTAQVLIGSALLFATPWLLEWGGMQSYYVFFALLFVPVMFLLGGMPITFQKHGDAVENTKWGGIHGLFIFALLAVLVYFAGMNSFWAFVERIGDQGTLTKEYISSILSASILVSVIGSLAAAWMSDRYGRIGPIVIGLALTVGAVGLLLLEVSPLSFMVSIFVFNLMYNFVIPFQSGWVANLDLDGRNTALLPAVQGAGLSLGPILVGYVVAGSSYTPVIFLSVGLLLASIVLFILLRFTISDREERITTVLREKLG